MAAAGVSDTVLPTESPMRLSRIAAVGFACAFLALLIVPEIFGSVAVLLGAYVWREERRRRGLWLVVLGLVCLMIGVYLTSYFELGDLLPLA